MNALLIRVAADQSTGGGSWNGPVDGETNEFVYVSIPEVAATHPGLEKPYALLQPVLARFGSTLPAQLAALNMHLDPDFGHLTYGDAGRKAVQLQQRLTRGDLAVFYAGLKDRNAAAHLVYAIIGILEVDDIVPADAIAAEHRDTNAHARRVHPGAGDVVVRGTPGRSGRLARCLPIGEFRDRAYRVRRDLLDEWGGLSVSNGYLQRSAQIPSFLDPQRFLAWFERQRPCLMASNN